MCWLQHLSLCLYLKDIWLLPSSPCRLSSSGRLLPSSVTSRQTDASERSSGTGWVHVLLLPLLGNAGGSCQVTSGEQSNAIKKATVVTRPSVLLLLIAAVAVAVALEFWFQFAPPSLALNRSQLVAQTVIKILVGVPSGANESGATRGAKWKHRSRKTNPVVWNLHDVFWKKKWKLIYLKWN